MAPKRRNRASADREARPTSTPAETAPSSPILAHTSPSEALPTRTQLEIQTLLHAESEQRSVEAFLVALTALEKRQLPLGLSPEQMLPEHHPRSSCFDAASVSRPTWSAHDICERCRLISELRRVSAKSASPVGVKMLLGTAHAVTDCRSEQRVKGKETPALPHELLEHVIEFALDDLRTAKDGTALAKLMHVSSDVRFRIFREFAPVTWYEGDVSPREVVGSDRLVVCRHVHGFLWDLIEAWAQDVTVKRHTDTAPVLPSCSDVLTTPLGDHIESLSATVHVYHGGLRVNRAHFVQILDGCGTSTAAIEKRRDVETGLSITSVCAAIAEAFKLVDIPPRFASPWQRAMMGKFDAPYTRTVIDVKLEWQDSATPDNSALIRIWRFNVFNGIQ